MLLDDSERRWADYVATVCSLKASRVTGEPWDVKGCLQEKYDERVKQLADVGQRKGPFVLNRVDLYAVQTASDETGWTPGFYSQHVAYPQIDNLSSKQSEAWSKANVKTTSIGYCETDEDNDTDYKVGFANGRMISVEWTDSFYCHGAAHGQWNTKVENVVLFPRYHRLTAPEMFGTGGQWVGPLRKLFWAALTQSGWEPPPSDHQSYNVKADILNEALSINKWSFDPGGITVAFNSYDGGCYICTPKPVTVTWARLRPLLSRDAVVP